MSDQELNSKETEGYSMPFLQHLEELRWRLVKSIVAVILMSFVAFYFAEDLIRFIKIPLGDVKLYNIQVTGAFYAYLKISLIAGILGALPIVFYQVWSFISPGLYRHEKRTVLPLVMVSTLLFLVGAGFCYVAVLPMAFQFLIGFSGDLIVDTITIGSYISFVGLMLMAFGCSFQLPVLAYFLARIGLVSAKGLAKGRRYAIVIILIVAAIITPPDVFTQVVLAIPLYLLYEISIIVAKVAYRERVAGDSETST